MFVPVGIILELKGVPPIFPNMNAHIATLQLLLELENSPDSYQLPLSLREIAQKFDVPDYDKLSDSLLQEIQQIALTPENQEGFSFLTRIYFVFQILSLADLTSSLEVLEHRIHSPRSDLEQTFWDGIHQILGAISNRSRRKLTLEEFEDAVGLVNWGELGKDPVWMSTISGLIGLTYLLEEQDQVEKAPLWLNQATKQGMEVHTLVFKYEQERYALDRDPLGKASEAYPSALLPAEEVPGCAKAYRLAELDLTARVIYQELHTSEDDDYEDMLQRITELDQACRDLEEMSSCSVVVFETLLAKLYVGLAGIASDASQTQMTRAMQYFDRALSVASGLHSQMILTSYKAERIATLIQSGIPTPEKEVREPMGLYKKQQQFPEYVRQLNVLARLYAHQHQYHRLADLISDGLKYSGKQTGAARYFLLLSVLRIGNLYMIRETQKPGVSWMVSRLEEYFKFYETTIQELFDRESMEAIGGQMFEEFRRLFQEFSPLIHFNILVFYRYQYQSTKLLALSLHKLEDESGKEIANQLIQLLNDPNNPMSLIKGDWEEFKDIPNDVRNKTLNKCIDISKGDLPLAAEQLDFSYRNLRSYITFKEVNRLGFFLDQTTTANRQLEQGIRYMFHDLYKQGTIFEVVFDMPKFLIDHLQSGFFSQDLEEVLSIKGTTAKKYIKIMASIGMIYQEKIPGRKHFYRVKKDEIMKRLGSDQATLIQP